MLHPVTRDLPPKKRRAVHGLLRDLDVGLRGWLHATLIAMASAAILTYVGYKFAGLRFAPAPSRRCRLEPVRRELPHQPRAFSDEQSNYQSRPAKP